MTPAEKWQQCLEIIKCNIPEQEFHSWFLPIRFDSYTPRTKEIVLFVPSNYFYEYLEGTKELKHVLLAVLWKVYGQNTTLKYKVDADHTNNITTEMEALKPSEVSKVVKEGKGKNAKQVVVETPKEQANDLNPQLNTNYTFENFIEGESNRLPRTVGQSIADNPQQQTFNPLFIYGSSGVGKTHLLNAIGTRLKQQHPAKRLIYLSAHQFEVQFTESRRTNKFNDFIHFYQSIDVLLIDDIQELEGKEATQNAFFHIFNHLKMNGKQMVFSSDRTPSSLQGMEERLITRFKWGLVTELAKPNEELCRRILLSKIARDGLRIPAEVIEYVVKNVNESVRALEGVVNSLMAYSIVFNREIDIDMAALVVDKTIKKHRQRNITKEDLIRCICEVFQVEEEDVLGQVRKANFVVARQAAMLIANEELQMPASKIGKWLGGRNHATILHGIKQMRDRQENEPVLANQLKEVRRKLKG